VKELDLVNELSKFKITILKFNKRFNIGIFPYRDFNEFIELNTFETLLGYVITLAFEFNIQYLYTNETYILYFNKEEVLKTKLKKEIVLAKHCIYCFAIINNIKTNGE